MSYKEALEFFGLTSDYTIEELKKKYYPMIREIHPDANLDAIEDATLKSQVINQAYMILKNKLKEKDRLVILEPLKEKFVLEINDVLKKYSNNREIKNLSKRFLSIVQTIKTKEELDLQIEQFRNSLKIIQYKMMFLEEKDKFKRKLIIDSRTRILINVSTYYQEILENIYSLNELLELEEEYKEHVKNIVEEDQRRKFNYRKASFEKILNTSDLKYQDLSTRELVEFYRNELKNVKTIQEIDKLQNEFDGKFKKVRQIEQEISNFKLYLIDTIKHYQKKYSSSTYEDIFLEYLKLMNESNTLESLKKIEKDFLEEVRKIKIKEESILNNYLTNKDNAKRAVIYYFYKSSLGMSTERIIENKELLESLLEIVDKSSIDDIEKTIKFISSIDYTKPKSARSKINLYTLARDGKIKIKDLDEVNNIPLKKDEEQGYLENKISLDNQRSKLKEELLKKQYHYATNVEIDDINHSLDLLISVLKLSDNMTDAELNDNFDILLKIDFHNMKNTKEIIELIKPSNKVFISYKDGDLCILKPLKNQILVISLDSSKPYEFIDFENVDRNFISVNEFFKKATYAFDGEVEEMIDRYESRRKLYLSERSYLYFYKNLMLEYFEPLDKGSKPYFDFTVSATRFGWVLKKSFIERKSFSSKFENRDLCENMFMEQISSQVDEVKKSINGDIKKI